MKENRNKTEQIGVGQPAITFLRHSFKDKDGNLTDEGIVKARALDFAIPDGFEIKIFTSDIGRSEHTGKLLGEKLGNLVPKIDPILSEFPYTDEHIEELGLSGLKWLSVNEATKLLAAKIAKFTLEQIKNTNTNTQIIAISHVPPIMAFLGHTLAYTKGKLTIDEKIKSELFETFGGKFDKPAFVKPLEGFEIKYDGSENLTLVFSNHNLQIPISFLRNLNT